MPTDNETTNDAERADALWAAINYALDECMDPVEGMHWLEDWRGGDPKAMADLNAWKAKNGKQSR